MELHNNSSTAAPYGELSSCFFLPNPAFEKVPERYTNNLITAIVNVFFAPFAVVSNLVILFLLWTCPQLRNPSNVLLGCLAFSDLCVGLIVQPSYIIFRMRENQHHFVSCPVRITYSTSFYICYGVSFMTLSAISCERYIALKLHLRYKELVTTRRVYSVAAVIWIMDIILTALQWAGINNVVRATHMALWFVCSSIACIVQYNIYRIVQRHRRQILRQHQQSGGSYHRQTNLTISLGYIVCVYMMLNVPVLVVTVYHQIARAHLDSYDVYSWTETIAFLNSSLNPLICAWKRKDIRRCLVKFIANCSCVKDNSRSSEIGSGAYVLDGPSTPNRSMDMTSKTNNLGTNSFALSRSSWSIENTMPEPSVQDVHL